MTTDIQTDPDLEALLGREDIYIHPEGYSHVLTLDPPLPRIPGALIIECDRWRAWAWLNLTLLRKLKAGIGPVGFRRKVPYSRLIPIAQIARGIAVVRRTDGGNVWYELDPYRAAVDPSLAAELTGDAVPCEEVTRFRAWFSDGTERAEWCELARLGREAADEAVLGKLEELARRLAKSLNRRAEP